MLSTEIPEQNPTSIPTQTPTPTFTASPTSSPTYEPSFTPIIVSTGPKATAKPPLRLGREESLPEAGFSYKAPVGYSMIAQPNQITMTSMDQDTVFSFIGGKMEREDELAVDFEQFIQIISVTLDELTTGELYQYDVGGAAGIAAEVNGLYGENRIAGRVVVVAPSEDQIFYALAISPDTNSGEGWEPEGRQAFEAVVRTISFFEPILPSE